MCPPPWNLFSCIMFHLRPKHKFQTLAANRTAICVAEEEEMGSVRQCGLYTFKPNPISIGIFHIHIFTLNIEHFCLYLFSAGVCHPSPGFNFTNARLLAARWADTQLLLKERKILYAFLQALKCTRLAIL